MDLKLNRNPEEFLCSFKELKVPKDVSELLEVPHRHFNFWLYRQPDDKRYTTFYINKKSGGQRRIDVPTTNIKILQQKLNQILQVVYSAKPSVHAFVPSRNVKSNAERHVKKRWVLNIDLKDFFPSIHFGRVRGMLMGNPYNLPAGVATILANLCCFQRRLPQGAPTSPVISNMICAQMDSKLQQLAKRNRCTYTRYADDIFFSTTSRRFPRGLAFYDRLNQLEVGKELIDIIESSGFIINLEKVKLKGREVRQVVTGVTVNEFPNLPRKYTKQIRAMLHAWRIYGLPNAQREWEEKYNRKQRAPWVPVPDFEMVVKGKIEYLGMIKGLTSCQYLKFMDQLGDLDLSLTNGRGTPLRLLCREFESLSTGSVPPQTRGFSFEGLMNRLFKLEEISVRDSFRRNQGGEQIDGAFALDGWYHLVECKWQATVTNSQQVDGLSMKVSRSGTRALGLFISINGWSRHVVNALKANPNKSVFLMNGDDIYAVLLGRIKLLDLLHAKSEALNVNAEPFLSAEEAISSEGRG